MSKSEQSATEASKGVEFGKFGAFDTHIYEKEDKDEYVHEIRVDNEESDSDGECPETTPTRLRFGPSTDLLEEAAQAEVDKDEDPFKDTRRKSIAERESEYQSKARARGALTKELLSGEDTYAAQMKNRLNDETEVASYKKEETLESDSSVSSSSITTKRQRWDDTGSTKSLQSNVKSPSSLPVSRWDQTPVDVVSSGSRRSRWDQTPEIASMNNLNDMKTPVWTPSMQGMETPRIYDTSMTPEVYNQLRWQREMEERNRPLSDEELDQLLPTEGYDILTPPSNYVPLRTPSRKLVSTPTPDVSSGYRIPGESTVNKTAVGIGAKTPEDLEGVSLKPEDYEHFSKIFTREEDSELSSEEQKERTIMILLLKIKNGTPPIRKSALRMITERAREFGPGPLFNQILPLLMSPTLEDQERHLLVKVIDRVLFKLDDAVRPYVHKILVVIEPLLIDEDYYARVEGREIISNLAKAAGLATMIATMRPDIDNPDEYVRNTTSRAFCRSCLGVGHPFHITFSSCGLSKQEKLASKGHTA
eukprot:jgi/Galph1/2095/GphlegSOOS_G810.1